MNFRARLGWVFISVAVLIGCASSSGEDPRPVDPGTDVPARSPPAEDCIQSAQSIDDAIADAPATANATGAECASDQSERASMRWLMFTATIAHMTALIAGTFLMILGARKTGGVPLAIGALGIMGGVLQKWGPPAVLSDLTSSPAAIALIAAASIVATVIALAHCLYRHRHTVVHLVREELMSRQLMGDGMRQAIESRVRSQRSATADRIVREILTKLKRDGPG